MSGRRGTLKERLDRHTNKTAGLGPSGECWLWTGGIQPNGYGMMRLGAASLGNEYVHRVAFYLKEGRLPTDGKEVCHSCDLRHCVNPAHLWEGTRRENLADMTMKGRRVNTPHPGEKNWNHKLTAYQVVAIRRSQEAAELCAARYKVSKSLIYQIRRRAIWQCIEAPI